MSEGYQECCEGSYRVLKTRGINRTLQKESNIKQIIQLLYRLETCSRVSLAKEMNLTQAAMTKRINPLIESGLIEEVSLIDTDAGRKPKQLKLSSRKFSIIAGRINRDYVIAAVFNLCGELVHEISSSFDRDSKPEDVFETFKGMISEVMGHTSSQILGIGVAVPGPFNMFTNTVTLVSGFAGWNRIDIKCDLEKCFNLPVFLEQDANCGALAELWCRKDNRYNNIVYVTADRGVGSCLVVDGCVYHGNVGYAGEFGHMSINFNGPICECGNHGCLELYCSTNALEKRYREISGSNEIVKIPQIFDLVKSGDEKAREAYDEILKYLAFGCASIVNVMNPDVIIFADKITGGGEYFLTTMRRYLKQFLMNEVYSDLAIEVSTFAGDPTVLGASVNVLERMLETKFNVFIPE